LGALWEDPDRPPLWAVQQCTEAGLSSQQCQEIWKLLIESELDSASFEERLREVCLHLEVLDPAWIINVAIFGQTLAEVLPELKLKRGRGRPPGSKGPEQEWDKKLLDAIEMVMKEPDYCHVNFEAMRDVAVGIAIKRNKLPDDKDRTTHNKRVTRRWKQRRQNDASLAHALLYGRRCKDAT
jgi:hypothetical protein